MFFFDKKVNIKRKMKTRILITKNPKNILFYFLSFFIAIIAVFLFFWTNTSYKNAGTIKVYDRNGFLLYEETKDFGRNRPLPLREIPENIQNAVISIEDKSFRKNPGFDLQAIARAVYQNLKEGEITTGASTITQQLVRLKIFDDAYKARKSYLRKTREILTAARLGFSKTKDQILEDYLNNVYFGNRNYGVEAASNLYFDKSSQNLSLAESAFLAGIISSPEKYNPYNFFDQAKQRQEYVLDLMVENNFISKENADQAKSEQITISDGIDEFYALHFVDYVIEKTKSLKLNEFEKNGGLKIYTTLNLQKYLYARGAAEAQINKLAQKHEITNSAIVLLDNNSGEILVMMGGINYYDEKNGGYINMAIAERQPGSSIKPITYAVSFTKGYTPATIINDTEKVYITKKGESYIPKNYDGIFRGNITIREALASSINMPAVEILDRIGVENMLIQAQKMGVSTLTRTDEYDLALTLGGGEVQLLELTNVYSTFARGGEYLPVYSVKKISDDLGNILYQHKKQEPVQTLGENGWQIAYLITDILSDQKARMIGFGEKNQLVLSRPAAVKTGTTTDWHDVWTIGYTPDYSLGVWVGNNNNTSMKDITGLTGAAPIWNQVFEHVLTEIPQDDPRNIFSVPEGIITKWICKDTGLLDNGGCLEKYEEVFIKGSDPIETSPPEPENSLNTGKETKSDSFINILSPSQNTEYELAPDLISNETIVFEVSTSKDIKKIQWILNEKTLGYSDKFPFNYYWKPEKGNFTLTVKGCDNLNNEIISGKSDFSIVLFKQYDELENN